MGSMGEPTFSAPAQIVQAEGLLFDFDGTIVDSTDAIIKHWHKLGAVLGVDPNLILATSHGRRSIDVLKIYDESKANWDYISHLEGLIPIEYGKDAVEIPGSRKLLATLDQANVPWAVVTSGTRPLLSGWIKVLNLAQPNTIVTAEDVENGKPDPACYRLGRERLRFGDGARMIVVEDAPSGIRAGKAAGFQVIGLTTTHTIDQVRDAGADWIVQDLNSVTLKDFKNGIVQIAINDALSDF